MRGTQLSAWAKGSYLADPNITDDHGNPAISGSIAYYLQRLTEIGGGSLYLHPGEFQVRTPISCSGSNIRIYGDGYESQKITIPIYEEYLYKIVATISAYSEEINNLIVFNNKLYGCTRGTSAGGTLLEYNPLEPNPNYSWIVKANPFESNRIIHSIVGHDGSIYGASHLNASILRWDGASSWVKVTDILPSGEIPFQIIEFNNGDGNKIYISTTKGRLYRLDLTPTPALVMVANRYWATDAPIYEMVVFDDGDGESIYAGSSSYGNLLKWNGIDSWVSVAPQIGGQRIMSLCVHDDTIFAGTLTSGHLQRWDKTANTWTRCASFYDPIGIVYALHSFNGTLYGGGHPRTHLLKWNGIIGTSGKWELVARELDLSHNGIRSIIDFNENLYVGGHRSGNLFTIYETNESPQNIEWRDNVITFIGNNIEISKIGIEEYQDLPRALDITLLKIVGDNPKLLDTKIVMRNKSPFFIEGDNFIISNNILDCSYQISGQTGSFYCVIDRGSYGIVSDNYFLETRLMFGYFVESYEIKKEKCKIYGNTFYHNNHLYHDVGIRLRNCHSFIVTDNVVRKNSTATNSTSYIYLEDSSFNIITKNSFMSHSSVSISGVYLANGSNNNNISYNTMINFLGQISLYSSSDTNDNYFWHNNLGQGTVSISGSNNWILPVGSI